ncbi:uncharacterized protein Z519_11486 [Cladophialophora bantiana CBS 173.52]|uniref:PNPLA domain-containing protein n=1 Tax=Cladophialophora bantiana (strain ATCC 10958 / CBS 173.52 / CDC B-1940 / NIH 8579) TaxID=1442370 RepID=A0A0D2FMH0_CLAB1|nr:uncharacterized protein Z519_11486 [Cladophialophora bantiana CBS 173.52]KIW87902.1 hypothetical protein Z519_11486 [Cladophialophora bantiana CBS 173.52]
MNHPRRLCTCDETSIDICTVRDAARATSAAPAFYKEAEITIRVSIRETSLNGGLGFNNPVFELYDEARSIFLGRHIDCLVSIYTGSSSLNSVPSPNLIQSKIPTNIIGALKKIAVHRGHDHDRMLQQFTDHPGAYFRFNIDIGLERIGLEEWKMLGDINSVTTEYLEGPAVRPLRLIQQDSDLPTDAPWNIFLTALQSPQIEGVYCIIDGLVECTDSSQDLLWRTMERELNTK